MAADPSALAESKGGPLPSSTQVLSCGACILEDIEIHFDPEGESLDILILHDGEGLDSVPMPDFNLGKLIAERRKGGLGICIMREMMDDLRFGKADSGKSMCVMVRYKKRRQAED